MHRIRGWENYKERVSELLPELILYWKETHPLRKPPIGLRFDFYHEQDLYTFIDFADGKELWKTKIPVHTLSNGKGHIDDGDIKQFLAKQFSGVKPVSMGCFSID